LAIFFAKNRIIQFFLVSFILIFYTSCNPKQENNLEHRYVITSPELAELVAAIKGTDNIVGVTTECNYPEQLKTVPRVGTFGKIDIEKVLEMEPTLVFLAGLEQDEIAFQLQKLGIPIISLFPDSIDDLLTACKEIGLVLEAESRADSLIVELQKEIDLYKSSLPKIRTRVYVEIYGNPIMSISDSSYVGELIELAGGDNIFSELPRAYSRIKAEEVISLDPEVILLAYPGVSSEDVKNRMGWEIISACRNNRIYNIDDVDPDLILRAGSRLGEGLRALKGIL
jgi:cobalamin transport system substrate-binding protein